MTFFQEKDPKTFTHLVHGNLDPSTTKIKKGL